MSLAVTTHSDRLALDHFRELALLVLLATLWGASYTFIKLGVETIPPLTLIAARTLIASVVLLAILRARRMALPRGANLAPLPVPGVPQQRGSVHADRVGGAVGRCRTGLDTQLHCSPIFTFLLTRSLPRRASATGRQLFGVVCGMLGICLIVGVQALNAVRSAADGGAGHRRSDDLLCGCGDIQSPFQALDPMLPATGSLLCGATFWFRLSLVVDRPWTLSPPPARSPRCRPRGLLDGAGFRCISG